MNEMRIALFKYIYLTRGECAPHSRTVISIDVYLCVYIHIYIYCIYIKQKCTYIYIQYTYISEKNDTDKREIFISCKLARWNDVYKHRLMRPIVRHVRRTRACARAQAFLTVSPIELYIQLYCSILFRVNKFPRLLLFRYESLGDAITRHNYLLLFLIGDALRILSYRYP